MTALLFVIFFSWFSGLQMGATWYAGVLGWLWRKLRRRVVRRVPLVRDLP